ncbi:MAG: prepilin-type N-terminal cleavage/methylation domain-containing protein [Spiribacter salinus]|uniref:Prepilin-type N-terminal cleavage/methylation domain-containing protein n=1 Tax=Spiribacter salinus TaxID=1335746 RepID=A0A540VQW7_9GAMM|nr:MAG: prepilin-type N-terminal cleavage/methylation domain-containing protein [Spiribacter salinus]
MAMNKTYPRQTQLGLSLIELVIAIAIIAIGAASISSLLVNSFQSVENTRVSGQTLRDGEACYETLLALHETRGWKTVNGQVAPYADCSEGASPARYQNLTVDTALATQWITEPPQRDALVNACAQLACRAIDPDSATPALQFRIEPLPNRRIELVVPINEAPGEN